MKEFQEILKSKREYYGYSEAAIEFAADAFADQFKPKWIPIEERLPEYHKNVLIKYNKSGSTSITEAYFCDHPQDLANCHKGDNNAVSTREFWAKAYGETWFDYAGRQIQDLAAKKSKNKVTHWMLLP